MLFFINFALGACPSKYVIAGPRKSSICRLATLERARASILEQDSEMPPLSRRATLERARASILEQGPEKPPSAGAPLCSALGQVYWSIFQRSARMGLCKKSS